MAAGQVGTDASVLEGRDLAEEIPSFSAVGPIRDAEHETDYET